MDEFRPVRFWLLNYWYARDLGYGRLRSIKFATGWTKQLLL